MPRLYLFLLIFICSQVIADGNPQTLIHIEQGLLQGHAHNGTLRYLGIPYAAAPVANLRWKPPAAPAAWEGIYEANHFSPPCTQIGNFYASNDANTFGKPIGSEDCLYLNIWVPTDTDHTETKPVLIFIHGGAGIYGTASLPAYEASNLARSIDAIVVTFNYRLGLLGNLHLPVIENGAFGLQDQVSALRWVQNNISHLGGNAGNVTLMGHSFGAVSLWSHMQSAQTRNLFHKGISLSGIPISQERKKLQKRDTKWLRRFGDQKIFDEALLDILRKHEAYEFLGTVSKDESQAKVLSVQLPTPCKKRECPLLNPVPTLIGTTANEASWLVYTQRSDFDAKYFWNLAQRVDIDQAQLIGGFSTYWFKLKNAVYNHLVDNAIDKISDRVSDSGQRVLRYRFKWADYPQPWRWTLGSFHGIDIPFIFGNFPDKTESYDHFAWQPKTLTDRLYIHQQFLQSLKIFIHDGNHPIDDWPDWNKQHHIKIINTHLPD